MAVKVDYVALIRDKRLATAFRQAGSARLHVLDTTQALTRYVRSNPRPAVWFREVPEEHEPDQRIWFQGASYFIAVNPCKEYLLRTPCPAALMVDTPRKLVGRVTDLIDELDQTASQRILTLQPSGKRSLTVTFLDGQAFELHLDPHHLADRVLIDPERRYLIVPRFDRTTVSIPWDAVRQPRSLLAARDRDARALAAALRGLRERAGMSQTAAAAKSRLTRQTIIRLEKAGHYPGLATLNALAQAYGIQTQDILTAAQREAS